MRRTVLTSFAAAKSAVDVESLAHAIEVRSVKLGMDASEISLTATLARQLPMQVEQAMVAASDVELGELALEGGYLFNPAALHVKAWLKEHTARRIKEIDKTTKAAILSVVRDAIRTGRHPYDAEVPIRSALEMAETVKGDFVGLTSRQSAALRRRGATWTAQGIPKTQVDKRMARAATKMLKQRAESIARTETMTALNRGRYETRLQLIADGILPKNQTHTWRTATDERVCPQCGPLNSESVVVGKQFTGGVVAPPIHIQCRCVVTLDR